MTAPLSWCWATSNAYRFAQNGANAPKLIMRLDLNIPKENIPSGLVMHTRIGSGSPLQMQPYSGKSNCAFEIISIPSHYSEQGYRTETSDRGPWEILFTVTKGQEHYLRNGSCCYSRVLESSQGPSRPVVPRPILFTKRSR